MTTITTIMTLLLPCCSCASLCRSEFRGFHVRFADVARGGIRLIKSASPQAYANNLGGLFEECYALARTQQRKNKVSRPC